MNNEENYGVCDYPECKMYLTEAVSLPCMRTVCKEHLNVNQLILKNDKSYKCIVCEKEHKLPDEEEGFQINYKLQHLVDFYVKSDRTRHSCLVSIEKLNQKINEYDSIKPIDYIDEYIKDFENKIEQEKRDLILLIVKRSDILFDKLKSIKNEWELQINNILQKNNFETLFTNEKINEWKKLIKTSNIDQNELKMLSSKLKTYIEKVNIELLNLRTSLIREIEFDKYKSEFMKLFNEKNIKNELIVKRNIFQDAGKLLMTINNAFVKDFFSGFLTKNTCIKLVRNKKNLISGWSNGNLMKSDLETGICVKVISHAIDEITCLDMLNNEIFASSSNEGLIKIWNIDLFLCLNEFKNEQMNVSSLCFISENMLACGFSNGRINICKMMFYSVNTIEKSFEAHANASVIFMIKTSIDEKKLLITAGSSDYCVKIWDLKTFELIRKLCDFEKNINSLQLTKDNDKLFSGSDDSKIKLWDLNSGDCLNVIDIECKSFRLFQNFIIISTGDKRIVVYDFNKFKRIFELDVNKEIELFELNDNGNLIISDTKTIEQFKLFSI